MEAYVSNPQVLKKSDVFFNNLVLFKVQLFLKYLESMKFDSLVQKEILKEVFKVLEEKDYI